MVVPPGHDDVPNVAYFQTEPPRIQAQQIAELSWTLLCGRENSEAIIGDVKRLYAIPCFC